MKNTLFNNLSEGAYKQLAMGNATFNNTEDSLSLNNPGTIPTKTETTVQRQASYNEEENYYPKQNVNAYNSIDPYFQPHYAGTPINLPYSKKDNININNIAEWENRHDKRNNMFRGALDIIEHYRLTRPIKRAYESLMDFKELREAAFAFKSPTHAMAALDLLPNSYKLSYSNISSDAQTFANKYNNLFTDKDEAYKDFYKIDQGENAIRHTIWQAAITSKYGAQVARDAGDAHETRPYFDVHKRVYDNENDADMATDLLNNKIGRMIGVKYKNRSTKEIALKVLDEFYRNGLYTYKKGNDGLWYIENVKLPEKFFYDLYEKILEH